MAKKVMAWKTKGMNQDLSVSAFNPEFAFENMNLRLSTNEKNTLMSWVTEKGTKLLEDSDCTIVDLDGDSLGSSMRGIPIGTAVLNHQLVLFTTNATTSADTNPDKIYKFTLSYEEVGEEKVAKMNGVLLYSGDLNFDVEHPIETLVSYEADYIQKVYWTDGINQPRLINISSSTENVERLKKWNDANSTTCFDFVPTVVFPIYVPIRREPSGSGTFAPGVIQYCITYINKYGQQSNIVWVSPLNYITHNERGASPEDTVSCAFKLEIDFSQADFDKLIGEFDCIRIYSIQRTSLNFDVSAKHLVDVPTDDLINKNGRWKTTVIDDGTTGSVVDPYELLYIGGKEVTVLTLMDKDSTLFMGNITEKNIDVSSIQEYFKGDGNKPEIEFYGNDDEFINIDSASNFYTHQHQLSSGNSEKITTFKGGENYRFGFQLQKATGEWSEPIWIGDATNSTYPTVDTDTDMIQLCCATANIPISYTEGAITNKIIDTSIYKRIRPLVVFPTIADRKVLCQGVLNPTVFNAKDRIDDSPYAQASWYFRPYTTSTLDNGTSIEINGTPADDHVTASVTAVTEGSPDSDFYDIDKQNGTYTGGSGITIGYFSNNCFNAYVLVGTIADNAIEDILSSQEIQYLNVNARRADTIKFLGAIKLATSGQNAGVYAFIKKTPWYEDLDCYTDIANVKVSNRNLNIKIYDKLRQTSNHLYYYIVPEPDPNNSAEYNFTFSVDYKINNTDIRDYWKVIFRAAISDAQGQSYYYDYDISNYVAGSPLRFSHLDSLYSSDEAYSGNEAYKQIEIEGSVKSYLNAYDTTGTDNKDKSNTQFFVDQSIVTLNSPDIEFNIETQPYSLENTSLKIVGLIPITSGASAHHIMHSSVMLEAGHNMPELVNQSFGIGEKDLNVLSTTTPRHLVSEYLWNDIIVEKSADTDDKIVGGSIMDYLVYPWQRTGSLNSDPRPASEASAVLKTKKESNLLYSNNSIFLDSTDTLSFDKIEAQMVLTENDWIKNYRFKRQGTSSGGSTSINYYPNIDKILYNSAGYPIIMKNRSRGDGTSITSPVSMKYKSTAHAAIVLDKQAQNTNTAILPYLTSGGVDIGKYTGSSTTSFWGDSISYSQEQIEYDIYNDFLWLAELCKTPSNPFGGDSNEALKSNKWVIGGKEAYLSNAVLNPVTGVTSITLDWTVGDTYYQRYDCLKTYPFTNEDPNQLVEILSFMCETRVNIDGRYDRNRGQIDNTNMSPINFNLLNPVYSQTDNFFTYKKVGDGAKENHTYPNQIAYSKTKTSGADIDLWTNVTLGSILELDGDKGEITSLQRFNDQLIAFQDSGISQVLYNENMQISTTQGVPIEIANSGKVNGKRYLSDTIGCSNKWSIVNTPSGIYFMDSNGKSIYLFNGQLSNISTTAGFNTWCKNNIPAPSVKWNPFDFDNFIAHYDKKNQDILFINKDTALAFSEKLGTFTSFYDYGNSPFLCSIDDDEIWIKAHSWTESQTTRYNSVLWRHQAGDYCSFFGNDMPYWMTLIGNPEPQMDKIFTNLEFRACVDGDGVEEMKTVNEEQVPTGRFLPSLPFDGLETWNEYQHGIATLDTKNGHTAQLHHTTNNLASLKRNFRIWRCDIPRDNASLASDSELNISRFSKHPLDRMRNPWLYLKLFKSAAELDSSLPRTEIHDVMMTYFE